MYLDADFPSSIGFRADCSHCILNAPCEAHRFDPGTDEPSDAEMAAMRQAAGMVEACDSLAGVHPWVRQQCRERGIESEAY